MSTISQRSFSGGEVSPQLQARVDFQKYQTSLKKLRNMIALKQGGAQNRPGTEFISEVKESHTDDQRLFPFDAGNGASYALEIGCTGGVNPYIRIFKNNVLIKDPAATFTVTNVTWGPAKIFGTGVSFSDSEAYFSGFDGPLGNFLNGRNLKLGTFSGGGWPLLNLDGTPFLPSQTPAYTGGGNLAFIYTVPWALPYSSIDSANLHEIKYAQSVDVLTLAHKDFQPIEILRNADDDWEVRAYGEAFDKPAYARIQSVTPQGTTGSTAYQYVATGVYAGMESGISGPGGPTPNSYKDTVIGNATLSSVNFNRITFASPLTSNGLVSPDSYNIYKRDGSGAYGYIGNVNVGGTFDDIGLVPDVDIQPPSEKYPFVYFGGTNDCPGAVGYSQQRRFFANTNNQQETVWGSDIGNYDGFFTKTPITDSDNFAFRAAGRKFNPVKHILDLSKFVLMTASSEIVVNPDGSVLTPTNINVKTQSYNGCSDLPPIIINESALYVQERGNIVRDLLFDFNIDGLSGNDISIFANHLFEGYELVDWCYQKVPNSTVWAVRSDGKLLCLTYLREQQVLAWSQHDLGGDGLVESCCSVSGDSEDQVYLIVKRNINGTTRKYVERLSPRFFHGAKLKSFKYSGVTMTRTYDDSTEVRILDSFLSYDGRNTDLTKYVTITGSGWTTEDTFTLTASAALFTSSDVGNSIFVYTPDGDLIRLEITGYTSSTVVSVVPLKNVPASLQGISTSDYARAVDTIRGLWHLEGEDVAIYSDGFVDASPNNPNYEKVTVTDGSITLNSNRAIVHVGLPFISDLQTLAIDTVQAETMIDKKIVIQEVTMSVEKTRGLFAGRKEPDDSVSYIDGLTEVKARNDEGQTSPIAMKTGPCDVVIESDYSVAGSVFIRQVDPLPVTILSIHPAGNVPFRRG